MTTTEEGAAEKPATAVAPPIAGFALSVEAALYVLLWGVGAALRLLDLGLPLLGGDEAQLALSAYQASRGGAFDLAAGPALVYGTAALFFAFAASDVAARLLPALAGTGLLCLPFLARAWMGRSAALFATALLALSPTLVYVTRQASAEALALLLLGLAVFLWLSYQEKQTAWRLGALGVLLGLLLASGPAAYALLGSLAVAVLVGSFVSPTLPLGLGRLPRLAGGWGPPLGLTVLLVATGGLSRLDGLQGGLIDAAGLGLGSWLRPGDGGSLLSGLGTLLVYEPMLLAATLLGVAFWRRLGPAGRWAFLWSGTNLLLSLWAGGSWLSFALLPAALVGGWALYALWGSLSRRFGVGEAVLFLATCLPVVWLFGIVAGHLSLPDAKVPAATLLVPPVLLWVAAVLWAWWRGVPAARNGLVLLTATVLFGFTLHAATAVAARDPLAPGELAERHSTGKDVRALLREIESHSAVLSRPGLDDVNLLVQGLPRYPLAWYLRQYTRVTYDAPVVQPALAIVPADAAAPGPRYLGQRFWLGEQATFAPVGPGELWRWLIYRDYTLTLRDQEAWLYVLPQVDD